MAFQRLSLRLKKSFPGLYSPDSPESYHSSADSAASVEPRTYPVLPNNDTSDCNVEDFGSRLERCKGLDSPEKDSPSKRKKMLGSLRSLRSLRNLHSSPSKNKHTNSPNAESPTKLQKDFRTTPSPVTASVVLSTAQSPPGLPIFEQGIQHHAVSASNLEVQHSSPMTVPSSTRQINVFSVSPRSTDLPAGTIPDTPGPMQRAFDRDPANHNALQSADPTPMEKHVPAAPVLTPLPGTNLTLDDSSPELAPLSPSMNPSLMHNSNEDRGYFDIPIEAQHGSTSSHGVNCDRKSTDAMNDSVHIQPVVQHGSTGGQQIKVSNDTNAHGILADHDISEGMRREFENLKLQDTVCIQTVHRDAQTLALRPKPKVDNFGDRFRKDSVINDHPDVNTNRPTKEATLKSDSKHLASVQLQKGKIANKGPISIASTKSYSGNGGENSSTAGYGYAICDRRVESHQSAPVENIWGRHTGLYDGTGYGDDTGLSNTPAEPDEGTKPLCMQSGLHSITVISSPPSVSGERVTREDFSESLLQHVKPYP